MEPEIETTLNRLTAENKRLRRAVEELSILNEIATAVTSTSSLDTIIDLIVQKCVKHLAVEQGAVLLFGEKEQAGALRTMVRRVKSDLSPIPYRLSDQITGWMLKNQSPLIIHDLANDERFRMPSASDAKIRSLMCVPLRLKGRMIGVLNVLNKQGSEGFTDTDQRLLTIIGAQSAQVIENARLYEEEKALQLMQQEMQMAREIQTNLLPVDAPRIAGYEIAGDSVPARNVGGDYFDFLELGPQRLAVCLGDVSGKGMPAAMLMANVQATVRGQTLPAESAAQCMERSNHLLHDSTDSQKFVTLFYAILDWSEHRLRYSNAGHNPPFLLSEGRPTRKLETGGPVLGVLRDVVYEEDRVTLQPGDLLMMYSDGITEGMNSRLEEFGEERLLEVAGRYRREPLETLISGMYEAVREYCGDTPPSDDMTMVVLRRGE